MKVHTSEISLDTAGEVDVQDITDEVQRIVDESGIENGIAVIFCVGSTCAISTIEYEPGLKKDLPEALERLFPKGIRYHHEDTWHDGNGHSHVRATFLKPELTVPVVNGKLTLGTWQQIIFIELDVRRRHRRVVVQVLGL
ncbi:MAG: YjbQ family protein [Euryarchaeota archaeon]|nr:YjbQ family protein [Euryarchaeota archaeon]